MNIQSILECERRELERFRLLPPFFKRIGWLLFSIGIILFFAVRAYPSTPDWLIILVEKSSLLGLLLVATSRDIIEDELTKVIRARAIGIAFVTGMLFAIFQPLINYTVGTMVKPDRIVYSEMSNFSILWFMLIIQIAIFFLLKRTR